MSGVVAICIGAVAAKEVVASGTPAADAGHVVLQVSPVRQIVVAEKAVDEPKVKLSFESELLNWSAELVAMRIFVTEPNSIEPAATSCTPVPP